jgi:predicted transcriptional regulator
MRTTKVYSITMPPDLARQADALAKKENRTMSELVREALRRYQQPLPVPLDVRAEGSDRAGVGGGLCQGSEGETERLLRSLANRTTCDWCEHPIKPVHRTGLCRHCYGIRANTNRLEKKIEEYRKRPDRIPIELSFRYRATLEMETDAKKEGEYGSVDAHSINGLNLEHRFSYISRMFVHQDLYHGYASVFDCFTPSQKRLVSFLLSLMTRAYLRRTRRHRALNSTLQGDG